jgi:hypothetical protein
MHEAVFEGFFNFIEESHRLTAFETKRCFIGSPVNPIGMVPVIEPTLFY